jgi:hypothetical protein
MNGTLSKTGQSVWSVLDRLRNQLPGQSSSAGGGSATANDGGADKETGEEVLDDDDSSVMVYGPLLPTDDSQIELAKFESVHNHSEETDKQVEDSKPEPGHAKAEPIKELKEKLETMWPFQGKQQDNQQVEAGPSNERVHFVGGKSKRIWIPSPDKISIQVMWWGYRMYVATFPYV